MATRPAESAREAGAGGGTAAPAPGAARIRLARLLLALLALIQGIAAVWALVLPRAFFDDFPGAGATWVRLLPPYNEHLITDYGASFLALSVLLAIAAWLADVRLLRVASVVWLVAAVPHLVWHLFHLDGFGTADAVAQTFTLALTALAPIAVLIALRGIPTRSAP